MDLRQMSHQMEAFSGTAVVVSRAGVSFSCTPFGER